MSSTKERYKVRVGDLFSVMFDTDRFLLVTKLYANDLPGTVQLRPILLDSRRFAPYSRQVRYENLSSLRYAKEMAYNGEYGYYKYYIRGPRKRFVTARLLDLITPEDYDLVMNRGKHKAPTS